MASTRYRAKQNVHSRRPRLLEACFDFLPQQGKSLITLVGFVCGVEVSGMFA